MHQIVTCFTVYVFYQLIQKAFLHQYVRMYEPFYEYSTCMYVLMYECINLWMNEYQYEWMNISMNEWMNEQISECMHVLMYECM